MVKYIRNAILCFIIVALATRCCYGTPANAIGEAATTCASSYCTKLDALQLWMKIQPICHPLSPSTEVDDDTSSVFSLSSTFVGVFCFIVSLFGIYCGYRLGSVLGKRDHGPYALLRTYDDCAALNFQIDR